HGVNLRAQPPELAEAADPTAAFRSYFEDLRRGATRNTDLKLVLVGNGRVGKTTLKHCLVHGVPPPEPIRERTHGIDATTLGWPAGGEEFRVTIWDLAGQEIYHTMHRFLLHPRVVFLLLWAEETEETDPRELHPVSYWLDLIGQLGSGSVTILVKTQIDRGQKHGTRPPELVGVEDPVVAEAAVSAAQGRGIGALRETISEEIVRFRDRWGYLLPTSWLAVRAEVERLRDSGHRELPFAQFEQLCTVHDARHPRILADYLGQSGFLFYRPGHFGDRLILDQDWLLERIYAVFDPRSQIRQRILRAGGSLFADDTASVWPDHDPHERQVFLGFLTGAELAFHVEGSDPAEYVVPALLPEAPPPFRPGTGSDDLWLEVRFGTLHRALIERLIVRLSGMSPHRRWWRDGIDIEAPDRSWQASVEAWWERNALRVHIHPLRASPGGATTQRQVAASLLRLIRSTLPGAEPVIAGSLDGVVYIDLEKLEQARVAGNPRCVDRSGQVCDVAHFAALPTRAELERAGGENLIPEERPMTAEPQKLRIFVSYAHEDKELKKVLMKRLEGIARSHPIESWDDSKILAGTLVHEEILKGLNAADITLLLISPDFVTSDYCWTQEMEIALQQYEREGKLPVPIIVRRTPEWHEAKIGQHLALPKDGRWLTAWPSPDDFWGEVEEGLRDLIRDLMEKRGIPPKRY
ncbi:MAG: TIR domain-containing protein, partial [Gemmatimonadetes bacterium]|nr:TIR domain-containing protein [Gemmatimonadota bacterium]